MAAITQQQLRSTSMPHRNELPEYCLMVGVVHPANLLVGQSSKFSLPSQWAYQSGQLVKLVQLSLLPMIWFHMQPLAQMPTALPLASIAVMSSWMYWQLDSPEPWFQVQPELGLVSMSSQMVPVWYSYREGRPGVFIMLSRKSMSSLTCVVAFLPRQGNMQTSVESPAWLDSWILPGATVSMAPQLWYARMMECSQPRAFMQVKFLKALAMSNTLAEWARQSNMASRMICVFILIDYQCMQVSYVSCKQAKFNEYILPLLGVWQAQKSIR